jgi:glycerol-3-phosphate O-acyltransferase
MVILGSLDLRTMRNDLRDTAAIEVTSRVLAACVKQSERPGGVPLEMLLNETFYYEKKRLAAHRNGPGWAKDVALWDGIKTRMGRAGTSELRDLLHQAIAHFVAEVVGNFDPRVYAATTRMIPKALPFLLNGVSPKRFLSGLPAIADTVQVQGALADLRRCHDLGTVILTPTHVSHLDSVVLGWALYEMGLPPFTYGAGLNLFSNPMLAFFMQNLGAYRVDRLKQAPLYKDVLKEYATVSLELGQHNLFFPGGTRTRSGAVEEKLKLGLLSAGLRAYIQNLIQGKARPKIYVVPCTLNYQLVLEAETLVEDHLKAHGKARYIITDDEFSRPRRVWEFLRGLIRLDSRIHLTIGEPLDPFGNQVDPEGESRDTRGRPVDIARYVLVDDRPAHLPQRDRVYTAMAGEAVARSFKRHNVCLATNLTAFSMFHLLKLRHPQLDLFKLLRTAGDGAGLMMAELCQAVRRHGEDLKRLERQGQIRVSEAVAGQDASAVVAEALKHFGTYHPSPVVYRRGDRVFAGDMNLLYYYSNRLVGYGLETAEGGAS